MKVPPLQGSTTTAPQGQVVVTETPAPLTGCQPPTYWCNRLCGVGFGFAWWSGAKCNSLCVTNFHHVGQAIGHFCEHGACGLVHHEGGCVKPCDQCSAMCKAVGVDGLMLPHCKLHCEEWFPKVKCMLTDYCEHGSC